MTVSQRLQRGRTVATGLVPVVLLVAAWLTPGLPPRLAFLIAGTAVVAAGEAIRIWASGHRRGDGVLVTSGPFAHTRNPLYLASALMGIGFCLLSQLWWSWLLLGAVLVAFYLPTVGEEERHLAQQQGEAYQGYRGQVPRFGLRLSAYRTGEPGAGEFSWRHVLARNEHQMALWTALPVALFWLRLLPGAEGLP